MSYPASEKLEIIGTRDQDKTVRQVNIHMLHAFQFHELFFDAIRAV